jgi:hypothetical protein
VTESTPREGGLAGALHVKRLTSACSKTFWVPSGHLSRAQGPPQGSVGGRKSKSIDQAGGNPSRNPDTLYPPLGLPLSPNPAPPSASNCKVAGPSMYNRTLWLNP